MLVAVAALTAFLFMGLAWLLRIRPGSEPVAWILLSILCVIYYGVPVVMHSFFGDLYSDSYMDGTLLDTDLEFLGYLLSTLFVAGFMITYLLLRQADRRVGRRTGSAGRTRPVPGVGAVTALGLGATLALGLLVVVRTGSLLPQRVELLVLPPIFTALRYLSYGTVLTFFHHISRREHPSLVLWSGGLLFLFTYLVVLRDRAPVMALALAILVAVLLHAGITWKGVLAGLLVVYTGVSWQYARWHLGKVTGVSNLIELLVKAFPQGVVTSFRAGELGYIYTAYLQSVALVLDEGTLAGGTLVRLLLFPFPSSLFPWKPPETQLWFSTWLGVPEGGSRPVSIVGDAYLSLGLSGVVLVAVLFAFTAWATQRAVRSGGSTVGTALGALGPYALVLWVRGTLNGLAVMLMWVLLTTAIHGLFLLTRRRLR